jgi:serine/threonine-protein kinase
MPPSSASPTETSYRGEQASGNGDRSIDLSPAPVDRFLPGTVLEKRYRIAGLLGRGGMGEVYRADDLKLGRPVALKFLPETVQQNETRLKRFLNEVRVALRVTHPNVCRVHDIGEVDGQHYISMEYVDGEDLASLLRRIGRLPQDKAVQIARQICAGLAAAHEQGILHRDLKPANVMIDGRGRAKIADFGLAGLAEGIEGEEVRAGTPAYMAPEQLVGKEVTVRSDIYSLGLVLYELFTGKRAFEARSPADLETARRESMPPSPSSHVEGLDPAVERVILHCLERDPARRPGSPLAVAAALPGGDPLAAALAAGETPSPEMVANAGETEGLHPAVALVCLVLALVGIAAVPFFLEAVTVAGHVPLEQSSEVLCSDARRIIERAGHDVPPLDSVYGFEYDEEYLDSVKDLPPSPSKWGNLGTVRPAPIRFWYRQSPQHVVSQRIFQEKFASFDDPPWSVPGMAGVRLNPDGKLLELRVVPPRFDDSDSTAEAPDYTALITGAGFDPEDLEPTRPAWNPLVDCDARSAWVSTYPDQPEVPVRIEAGSHGGKPVYLEVIPPWRAADPSAGVRLPPQSVVLAPIVLTVLFIGIFLARRNLRMGRGDRRGAFRLAAFIFAVCLGFWVLRADHVPNAWVESRLLFSAIGYGLFNAGTAWLFYLAAEPYARRLWPDVMISWNRLLAGRLRDPLLGRDILVGALASLAMNIDWLAYMVLSEWLAQPANQPFESMLDSLVGVRQTAALFVWTGGFVSVPLAWLLLLLLLRAPIRKLISRYLPGKLDLANLLAVLVVLALITLPWGRQVDDPVMSGLFMAIGWAIMFFTLVRFGVLCMAWAYFFFLGQLAAFVHTTDPSTWFAGRSYSVLFLCAAIVVYGFYISLAGRSLFAKDILEAE